MITMAFLRVLTYREYAMLMLVFFYIKNIETLNPYEPVLTTRVWTDKTSFSLLSFSFFHPVCMCQVARSLFLPLPCGVASSPAAAAAAAAATSTTTTTTYVPGRGGGGGEPKVPFVSFRFFFFFFPPLMVVVGARRTQLSGRKNNKKKK